MSPYAHSWLRPTLRQAAAVVAEATVVVAEATVVAAGTRASAGPTAVTPLAAMHHLPVVLSAGPTSVAVTPLAAMHHLLVVLPAATSSPAARSVVTALWVMPIGLALRTAG